jgi:ABC-type bacteriocin/lantibiotic exporter with double-glycine peptidase domain
MRKFIPRYIGLFFLLIASSGLSLPGPAITGVIIDKVFVSKDVAKLNLLVGILLAILILSELVRLVQEYSLLRLSQEFSYSIRVNLVERILRYPLSFFKDYQTGYLVSRLDEVNLLGNFFSLAILSLAENAVRFGGAIFLISRYNLKLTILSLTILPLFFEVARRSRRLIRITSMQAMEKGAKVRGKIQETLSGIEVVKTFAKEGYEAAEISTGLRNMVELEVIQSLFSSLSGKIMGILTSTNLLLILWVGGHEIIAGRLSVGQYFAFVAYIGFLYGPIQIFAITFLQFQRAFMACKRISEFLNKTAENEHPEREIGFPTLRGDIKFEDVNYSYGSGDNVLHNINLSIRAGEKIAFIGKSGVGKSTLINLILGLYEPTSGHIEVDGFDIRTVRLDSLRNRIGIVSQDIFLFDDSILNNIKYSRPGATMEEVVAVAQASGCHDFISRLPGGYDMNAGEVGKKLSGGEKQRISIARCLLKNPDLIIFDEPAVHLDPIAIKNLITSIQHLFIGKTCIIVSHNLSNIHWVDRIYVLEKGRINQVGTHAVLIEEEGEYKNLFEKAALESFDLRKDNRPDIQAE